MHRVKEVIQKRPINAILIVLILVLYGINNLFLKPNTSGMARYFFTSHYNDLLAPFWILAYTNFCLAFKDKGIYKIWQILIFSAVVGLFWEFGALLIEALPSTPDPIDFLCYIIGGIGYWLLIVILKKARAKLHDSGQES